MHGMTPCNEELVIDPLHGSSGLDTFHIPAHDIELCGEDTVRECMIPVRYP